MKRNAKKIRFNEHYIYIEKREGKYLPYIDLEHAEIGVVSPSISFAYGQKQLKRAYETGELKSIFK